MMKRAPFSVIMPVRIVLLTLICISVARGCMCGVFMEQASRKPTAVKTSDVNKFSLFIFVAAQENTHPWQIRYQ